MRGLSIPNRCKDFGNSLPILSWTWLAVPACDWLTVDPPQLTEICASIVQSFEFEETSLQLPKSSERHSSKLMVLKKSAGNSSTFAGVHVLNFVFSAVVSEHNAEENFWSRNNLNGGKNCLNTYFSSSNLSSVIHNFRHKPPIFLFRI